MVDFSRVARQLDENPRVLPNPPGFDNRGRQRGVDRHQFGNEGNWATNAEQSIIENVLQKKKPNSQFEHLGGNNTKTDVLETDENNNQRGYSIKATKNPTIPTKMHQSGAQLGSSGGFRKLMMPGSDDSDLFTNYDDGLIGDGRLKDRFIEAIGDSPAGAGYLMSFGSKMIQGNGYELSDFIGNQSSEQREILEMIKSRKDNPFISPTEMKEYFGTDYDNFMNHLSDNKSEIFNQIVRQNEAKYPNSKFKYGDDFPIDRLAHLRSGSRDGRIFSDRFGGKESTFDIRDVSDDAINQAMENLNWYSDDESFYMAENETDDWNKRVLGIYPDTQKVDRWGAMPGRDRYDLRRKPAEAKPGLMKATMGIDEDMLNSVFGNPLFSAEINSSMNDGVEEVTRIKDLFRGGKPVLNNRNEEVMNFNNLHFSETLDVEQASAEKASASGEKQRQSVRQQRQKDMMAQKAGTAQKSNVVYASEDYFHELRNKVEHWKAQDAARVDWRSDIEEHRGLPAAEKAEDEGNHPYIDVMPHTNPHKKAKEKLVQNSEQDQTVSESTSFCEAFDSLVDEGYKPGPNADGSWNLKPSKEPINPFPVKKPSKPQSRKPKPMPMPIGPMPKDTRTDAEKMADAYASPRKGPGGAVRAD